MKKYTLILLMAVCLIGAYSSSTNAQAPYLGDIKMTALTFAQTGWMECNGQTLSISSNTALFSLLGTTYGGDGITTFALPDLRGRVPINAGTGSGLSPYTQGQYGGIEHIYLTQSQLPAHSHGISVHSEAGTSSQSQDTYLANSGVLDKEYATTSDETNTVMVESTGNNASVENRQPYLVIRYVICTSGTYPTRP